MSDKTLKYTPVKDPLAKLPVTGNIESDSYDEQKAMTDAFAEQKVKAGHFKGKEKKENDRQGLAMDTNYWCCLVFQSEAQKMAFLENAGLTELGPRYLDGRLVAKKFGVAIPEQAVNFIGEKQDKAMTLNFDPIEPLPQEGGE